MVAFPGSLDTLPKPSAATLMNDTGFEHDVIHDDVATAIEALEAKVGADSSAVTTSLDYKVAQRELLSNKATDFSTVNNTLYPTVQAVNNAITTAVVGLLDYRGTYNASTNLFPATGGSGTAGAIIKGDFWMCSVAGTLGGTSVTAGDLIIALVDTPAQTSGNRDLVSHDLGYTPENITNKVTSIDGSSTDTQYGSAKLLYTQLGQKKNFHGILSRSTVTPLPTFITTTTFTLGTTATPLTYYRNGVKTVVSTDKTTVLSGGAGLYWIYFTDDAGTLGNATTFPGVDGTTVLVATVAWNGTDYGLINDERHGYNRDLERHGWAHNTIGTRYSSGLTLTVTGTGASSSLSMTSGLIYDEDIAFTIPASGSFPTANSCRLWSQTGASSYAFDKTPSTTPYRRGTGDRPGYIDASTYAFTTLASAANRYVNYFVYTTTDLTVPLYVITETAVAGTIGTGYTSVANARAIPFPNLSSMGISPELKPIYRIIVRADGVVQTIDTTLDDYRTSSSIPFGAGTVNTSASAVSFAPGGTITATTVQTGMEQLDSLKVALNGALGTPTSGTLTNCTALPVAGITASTSTALGVGSIELGHATDTTISRVSAGVIAVEGVTVPTETSTNTISNKTLDVSNIITGSTINAQSGTTYTFVLTDAGKMCTFSNASAITVTVPPNSSVAFPIGAKIDCDQTGAGKVTFAQGSGVTIQSKGSNKAIGAQYVGVTLVKKATDTWTLYGDLIS